jgi:hypothetical protein
MIARVSPRPFKRGGIAQKVAELPSLTPAAKTKRKMMEAHLTDMIRQQVGKHVLIKFTNKVSMIGNAEGYGGKFADEITAAGMYFPAERIIQIAMADPRYPDLWRTALHEPFHAVQDLLATQSELKILKREDGRLREIATRELNLTPEQSAGMSQIEVQAVAYDTWARGQLSGEPLPTGITRLYQNIREFLRKAANAPRGLGFKSANDIFESTLRGDLVNRSARVPGRFVEEACTNRPVFPSISKMINPSVNVTLRLLRVPIVAHVFRLSIEAASRVRTMFIKFSMDGIAMANAMTVIFPYRHEGMWVFDDKDTGLVKEPFVAGIDEMIDLVTADIPNAEKGFRVLFSATPFPNYQYTLNWLREDMGGNWYRWGVTPLEGWLCPALLKYFDQAPKTIYCSIGKK